MTPLPSAVVELRLLAAHVMSNERRFPVCAAPDRADRRVAIVAELLDTLDRIDPGLGTSLHLAMYPTTTHAEGT